MTRSYIFNGYRDARGESRVWTVTTRTGAFIRHEHVRTEAEARGLCGEGGGNPDPSYRPDVAPTFGPTVAAVQNGR